jgi:hypothetical protein
MFKHLLEKRSQVHVESRSVRDMQQFDSAGEQQATEEKRCLKKPAGNDASEPLQNEIGNCYVGG